LIIRVLPARNGLVWLRDGLRLFGRRPISLLASVAAGVLLVFVPALVPPVGPVLAAIVAPIASLGMIAACRAVDAGQIPGLRVYAQALRDAGTRRDLLVLGAINAVIYLLLSAVAHVAGLDNAVVSVQRPNQAATIEVNAGLLALQAALYAPIWMANWLSPLLVGWHRLSPLKAMFYSFFACWRNRWPLLAFLCSSLGGSAAVTVLLLAPLALLFADARSAAFMIAPLSLGLMAAFQCSVFRMYAQIVQNPQPQPT
jgi:hypothetical protein